MFAKLARAGFVIAALGIAGCSESSVSDFAPQYASRQLPEKVLAQMRAKGMNKNAPIMARIFKEENAVEIWKQKTNGRYDIIATFMELVASDELQINYGSSAGTGHALQNRTQLMDLAAKVRAMAL